MRVLARASKRAAVQLTIAATLAAVAGVIAWRLTETSHAGLTVSNFPNVKPSGLYACASNRVDTSNACLAGALKDFDRARAAEGVKAMTLPTNYTGLTAPQQLLVLSNLERIARNLPPIAGTSRSLNSATTYGANHGQDPDFPSHAREGGSNWSYTINPLWTEFLWLYDDGPGGPNADCTPNSTSRCWGHRNNILSAWERPLLMGASTGSSGTAELILGADTVDRPDDMSWAYESRYMPGSVGGPPSSAVIRPRVPGRPGTPAARVSGRYVTLTWTAAAPNGSAVRYYIVHRGSQTWKVSARKIRVRVPLGKRTFRINAVNGVGTGPLSGPRVVMVR